MTQVLNGSQKLTIGAAMAVVVVVLAGLAFGWWEPANSGPAAGPAPSRSVGSSSSVVTLTNTSQGHTVSAPEGDELVVVLHGPPLHWSKAWVVSGPSRIRPVLTLVSSTTTGGSSTTRYRVTGLGTLRLRATGTPICHVAQACPQFVVLWQAAVTGVRSSPAEVSATTH